MQTIAETRRQRLALLVALQGGSLAVMNEAVGLDRTDATLSQIRTQARHSKTGKRRVMGDELARKIEARLHLPKGWMDTPFVGLDPAPANAPLELHSGDRAGVVDLSLWMDTKPIDPLRLAQCLLMLDRLFDRKVAAMLREQHQTIEYLSDVLESMVRGQLKSKMLE